MNMNQRIKKTRVAMKQGTFALAVAAALAFIPSARAEIVNVDFNGFQAGDVLGPTCYAHN